MGGGLTVTVTMPKEFGQLGTNLWPTIQRNQAEHGDAIQGEPTLHKLVQLRWGRHFCIGQTLKMGNSFEWNEFIADQLGGNKLIRGAPDKR